MQVRRQPSTTPCRSLNGASRTGTDPIAAAAVGFAVYTLVMMIFERQMRRTGGPGIIPFELAGNATRAEQIMNSWGYVGQRAARWVTAPGLRLHAHLRHAHRIADRSHLTPPQTRTRTAPTEAGKQFRRVNGHLHLTTLRAALEREFAETCRAPWAMMTK